MTKNFAMLKGALPTTDAVVRAGFVAICDDTRPEVGASKQSMSMADKCDKPESLIFLGKIMGSLRICR